MKEIQDVVDVENAATSGFIIVRTIEVWTPDMANMKPVISSLPLTVESAATDANPVVSTAPSLN